MMIDKIIICIVALIALAGFYLIHKKKTIEIVIDLDHKIVRVEPVETFVTVDVDDDNLIKVSVLK